MKRNVIQKAIMVLAVIGILSLTGFGIISIITRSKANNPITIDVKPTEVYQITEADVMEIIQPAGVMTYSRSWK